MSGRDVKVYNDRPNTALRAKLSKEERNWINSSPTRKIIGIRTKRGRAIAIPVDYAEQDFWFFCKRKIAIGLILIILASSYLFGYGVMASAQTAISWLELNWMFPSWFAMLVIIYFLPMFLFIIGGLYLGRGIQKRKGLKQEI